MLTSGVGYLCKIDGGVNAEMYGHILDDELMETIRWYGLEKKDIIFQQDNASCHTASSVRQWFQDNGIEVMRWPAHSPDLNPIEHLWDHLKRALNKGPPSISVEELWDRVQDIWNAITPETCKNLVRSMPKRLGEVRKAKGGSTKY